jgi:hypothetical protein
VQRIFLTVSLFGKAEERNKMPYGQQGQMPNGNLVALLIEH